MSIEEKECLLNKIDDDVEAVQKKFGSLTLALKTSLDNSRVDHRDLALFVSSLTIYNATKPNCQKKFADIIPEIKSCSSIAEILLILSDYWSWINYDLLRTIIDELGTSDDKNNIESYITYTLDPFLERSLTKIPGSAYGCFEIKNCTKLVLKIGTDMQSHSASSARRIKKKIAHHLGLEYHSLLLACIEDGCLQVTFLTPKIVIDTIFPLSQELLYSLSVLSLDGGKIENISTSNHNYDLVSDY